MDNLFRFHANLFAPPLTQMTSKPITLRGERLEQLVGVDGEPLTFNASWDVSWETVAARLESMPRMIFEPDGSWVWSGGNSEIGRWQVDGHLFEMADRLHRVEMHGSCPTHRLEELFHSLGTSPSQLLFELVQEGVTLDEEGFRRWAASAL